MAGEETAAGGRARCRCAQGLEPPLLARLSLLLRSSARYALPVRVVPPRPGLIPQSQLKLRASKPGPVRNCWGFCVKPGGWVSRRSAAACARQLLPWPGSGTVFTIGGCATQGGRASAGRLGDRPTIRGSRYASAFDTQYAGACRGDPVPERAAAANPASQRLPPLVSSTSCADRSSSSLLG